MSSFAFSQNPAPETGTKVTATSPTGGIGYTAAASGGAVTQGTSKSTTVPCTGLTGAITTHNAALASLATVGFTVTNTSVKTGDIILCMHTSGGTVGKYVVQANTIVDGTSFNINITNISGGSLSEAIVIDFMIFRAPTA